MKRESTGQSSPAPAPDSAGRPSWVNRALGWAVLIGCCIAYSAIAVPRLTNNAIGDLEFTGWSGAIAEHLGRGERPYVDFVLPIPPGSFALLALIQKISGTRLLLQELWVNAACTIGMALLAYAIARPFGSRKNAWLAAFASLVVLLRAPKECAYDYTAELCAWASVAAGARGLVSARGRARMIWLFVAGLCATSTFAFKQSTGSGVTAGWLAALCYLGLVLALRRDRSELGNLSRDAGHIAAGALLGVGLLWALLAALGSGLGPYYQAVFRDSAPLKGGSIALGMNLVSYLLATPAFPASLVFTVLAALVLVRISGRPGGFGIVATDASEADVLPPKQLYVIVGLAAAAFAIAIVAIARHAAQIPDSVAYFTDRLRLVPEFGLAFLCVSFAARLRPRSIRSDAMRGYELMAIALVALSTSLLHNLSFPEFRPFYDQNPIIPVAFVYLFSAFDLAELPKTKLVVYALALAALFSPKLDRVLAANLPTGRLGYWSGLFVNSSAVPFVHAAQRVWELTGPKDEVLVLPEDLELEALIGRPRPPLRGAVVFVDQYPVRLANHDIGVLESRLPKVVVLRPANRTVWLRLFALWASNSGARRVTDRFLDDFLPHHYRRDSSFVTRYADTSVNLEIWVLDH